MSTHPNAVLVQRFYQAFAEKNYRVMQGLYHPQAMFSDPAFPNLTSSQVKAMWEMLIKSSTDLRIEVTDVVAEENKGSCQWQAWYTFSKTGRKVHNIIQASFEFKDGLIYRHTDSFDFWRWSRMALGFSGVMLGWTPFLRSKVSAMAMQRLDKFMTKETVK